MSACFFPHHPPPATGPAARIAVAAGLLAAVAAGATAPVPGPADEIEAVRAEIAALRREYDERLARLEGRLAALEADRAAAPDEKDGLADLRAAAREAAGAAEAEEPEAGGRPERPAAPTVGRARNLNRLNPEISFTGIVVGKTRSTEREEFEAREFELDLQSTLDPFSRTRWTLAFREGEVEIEEGWVLYNALPGGLELAAGKFRQRFGALNRQHLHALPQSGYPLALETYFGEEGLGQTGLSLSWLPRRPWASANEITVELTDGENETAFGGESFEDLALLGRLINYWDLGPNAYFEWGLSGVVGETADGGDSRVWGTDFTYQWRPPGRAKYREITWRTELLLAQRDDPAGRRLDAWGGYVYVEGLVRRNTYAGVRFDRAEDPLDPDSYRWGVVPYLTWWQSEWVRLRGEYGYLEDGLTGDGESRFTLQLTWAAGPHKHETY